jgi:hypothetical protein
MVMNNQNENKQPVQQNDKATKEMAKYVATVIAKIISSLSSNVRNIFKRETLVKMVIFVIVELNENEELKRVDVIDKEKFNILLNAFYNKFKDDLKGKNIVLPIFLSYLVETIDKVLTEENEGELAQ